jgi:hypothetical protein
MLQNIFLIIFLSVFKILPLQAEVESLINYQGRLTDAQGNPVTGNRTISVRVYDAPTGGNMTYEEGIGEISVKQGLYNFRFGKNGAHFGHYGDGPGILNGLGMESYLALSVNGTEESTRTRLLAVPFSLVSQTSMESRTSQDARGLADLVRDLELKLYGSGVLSPPPEMGFVVQNPITVHGDFFIDRTETTLSKWQEVREWAIQNGYADLQGIGNGSAGDHPVHSVNWFDVVKWCNARSEMEGLVPVYYSGESVYRSGGLAKQDFRKNIHANGYRLPHALEWEWAAAGGIFNGGYLYSGGNEIGEVAWYEGNSNASTQSVATKNSNELGIHDMSGNVREWCGDSFPDFSLNKDVPYCRGGGWNSSESECAIGNADRADRSTRSADLGFRTVRRVQTSVEASGQFDFPVFPIPPTPSPFDQW